MEELLEGDEHVGYGASVRPASRCGQVKADKSPAENPVGCLVVSHLVGAGGRIAHVLSNFGNGEDSEDEGVPRLADRGWGAEAVAQGVSGEGAAEMPSETQEAAESKVGEGTGDDAVGQVRARACCGDDEADGAGNALSKW
jgi:hypothetical protein